LFSKKLKKAFLRASPVNEISLTTKK